MTTKKGRVRLKDKYDTPHKNEDSFNLSFVKKSLLTSCRRVGLSKKKPKINPIESPDPDLKDEIIDNTSTDSTELFEPFESSESKNQVPTTPTDDKPKSSASRRKKSSHPHKRDISETNNTDNDIVTLRIVSPVSKRRKLDLIDIFNPDKVIKSDSVSVSTVYKKVLTQDESDKSKNKSAVNSTVALPLSESKHVLSPSKYVLDLSNSSKNLLNTKKESNPSRNNQNSNKHISNSSKNIANPSRNTSNPNKKVSNTNNTNSNPSKTVSNPKKGSKKDLPNIDSLQESNASSNVDNSPKNSSRDLAEDLSVSKTLKSEDKPLKKRKLKLNERDEPSGVSTEQVSPIICDSKPQVIDLSKNKKRRPKPEKKTPKESLNSDKISERVSVGAIELTPDQSEEQNCNDDPEIFEHLPKLDKKRQVVKGAKSSKRRTPKIKLVDDDSSNVIQDSKNKRSIGKIESRGRRNKSYMNNAYMLSDRKIVVDNKSTVKSKQNNSITGDKISLSNSCNLNQGLSEPRSSCYTENNIKVSGISDKNSGDLLRKDNTEKMSPIEANETQKEAANSLNNQQEPCEIPQEFIGSPEPTGKPEEHVRNSKELSESSLESRDNPKELTGASHNNKSTQELGGNTQEVTGISEELNNDPRRLIGNFEPSGTQQELTSTGNSDGPNVANTQELSGNSDVKEMSKKLHGNPGELCGNPQDPHGNFEPIKNAQETRGNPLEASGNPLEVSGNPLELSGNPLETSGNPLESSENPLDSSGNPLEPSGNPLNLTGNSIQPTGILELNETQDFNDHHQETVPHIRNKAEKKIYTDVIFTPPRNKDIKSPTPPKIREKPKVDYDQLSEESYESSHYSPPAYSPIESRISEEHEIIISTQPSEESVDEISISCLPPGNNECSSSFVEFSVDNPAEIVARSPKTSKKRLMETKTPKEILEDDPVIIPMEIPVEIPIGEDVQGTEDDTEILAKSSRRRKNLQIKMTPLEPSMGMPDNNPIEILIVPPIYNPKTPQKESAEVKTFIDTAETAMPEKSSKSSRSKRRKDNLSTLSSVEPSVENPLLDSTEIQLESQTETPIQPEELDKPKDTSEDKNKTPDTSKVKSPKATRNAKRQKRHLTGSPMETSIEAPMENPKGTPLEAPMESEIEESEIPKVTIDTSDAIVQSGAKRVPKRKSLFNRRRTKPNPKKSCAKTVLDEYEFIAEDSTPEIEETETTEENSQTTALEIKKRPLFRSRGRSRNKDHIVPESDQIKDDLPEDKLKPIEVEESERIPDVIPGGPISEDIVLEQPKRRPPSRRGKKPEVATTGTKIDLGISQQASDDLTPINRTFDETTSDDKKLETNPQGGTEISEGVPKESQNNLPVETLAKNSEGIPLIHSNRTRRGYLKIAPDQPPDSSEIIPEGSSENIFETTHVSPVTISKAPTARLSLGLSKRVHKNNSKANLEKIEKTYDTAVEPLLSNSEENPENILDRITERLSKRITKRNNNTSLDRNSEETSEKITGRINDRVSSRTTKRRNKRIPDSPERILDTHSELLKDPSLESTGKILSTHDSNLGSKPKTELLNYYPRVLLNMDEIDNYFKQLEEQKLQALGYEIQNLPKSNQRNKRKSVDRRRKSNVKNRRSSVKSRLSDEDEMTSSNFDVSIVIDGETNIKNRGSNVKKGRSSVKSRRSSVKSRLAAEDKMSDSISEESNIIDGETNVNNQRLNVQNRRSSVKSRLANENELSDSKFEESTVIDGETNRRSSVRSRRSSVKSRLADKEEMSDLNFEESTVIDGETNVKSRRANVRNRRSIVKSSLSNVNSETSNVNSETSTVNSKTSTVNSEIPNVSSEIPNVSDETPEVNSEPSEVKNKTSPNLSKRSKTNETSAQNKPKLPRKRRRTRTPFGLKRRKRKAPPQIPLEPLEHFEPIEPHEKSKFNVDTDTESIGRMESVFFTPPSSRSENENENDSDTNLNPKDFAKSQMVLDNPFGEGTSMNCITPITSKVTTTGSFSSRQFEGEIDSETVEDREVASLSSKTTTARSESRVSRLSEVASSFGFDSNESESVLRAPLELSGTFKTYSLNENSSITVVQRGQCIEYLKWNNSAKRKSLRTMYSKSSILNRCVYPKTKPEKITSIFDDVLTEPSTSMSTKDNSTEPINSSENSTLPKPIDILRQVKEVESKIKSKKVILERLNKCDNLIKSTTELRKRAQGALLEFAAVLRQQSNTPFNMESLLYNMSIPHNIVGFNADDDDFI